MFSTGQTIFAILFVVVFVGVIILSYRKDKKIHLDQFRGSIWVLLGFLLFMGILITIKYLLTR